MAQEIIKPFRRATGAKSQKIAKKSPILASCLRLEAWLETMRGPGGYGGPVAHWWQQSLMYTGPGLDWRYEGIIEGYLQLWARTGKQMVTKGTSCGR